MAKDEIAQTLSHRLRRFSGVDVASRRALSVNRPKTSTETLQSFAPWHLTELEHLPGTQMDAQKLAELNLASQSWKQLLVLHTQGVETPSWMLG